MDLKVEYMEEREDAKVKRLADPYGDYAVTSDGKVISYKRNPKGEPVAQKIDKDGAPQVNLSNNKEAHGFKVFRVHSLVARAFLGEAPEGAEVLHKDGNPKNNSASNLEYGSKAKNAQQREAHKREDTLLRLDSAFEIGKWERTPEGYLRATAVVAREGPLRYDAPEGERIEYVTEEALQTGAETLLHKPVTFEHPRGGEVSARDWKTVAVGTVVESRYDSDLKAIVAGIVVHDEQAIRQIIEKKIREVSPGYRASVVPDNSGPWQYKQTRRYSNHLAITRAGRGGPESAIRLDSQGHAIPHEDTQMTEEEMQKKVDAMQSKLDAMQAKVDAFEKLAEKKKEEKEEEKNDSLTQAEFVRLFNERTEALQLAEQIGVRVDSTWTNAQVKAACVQKALGADFRADSEGALDGAYDAVRTMTPKKNTPEHLGFEARRNDARGVPAVDANDDLFAVYNDSQFTQFKFDTE